jgi:hypothetical protein
MHRGLIVATAARERSFAAAPRPTQTPTRAQPAAEPTAQMVVAPLTPVLVHSAANASHHGARAIPARHLRREYRPTTL